MVAASTNDCKPNYTNTGDSWACASNRKKLVRNSASGAGIWPVRRSNYPSQAVLRLAARDHLRLRSEVVAETEKCFSKMAGGRRQGRSKTQGKGCMIASTNPRFLL